MNRILFCFFLLLFAGCSSVGTYPDTSLSPTPLQTSSPSDSLLADSCKPKSSQNFRLNPPFDDSKRRELLVQSFSQLEEALRQVVVDSERAELLYVIGQKYLQEGAPALSLPYFLCAAENYYETKSMLKLANLYFQGDVLGATKTDYAKSYFWIIAALEIDNYDGQKNNIIANGLGLFDELQNVDTYVTQYGLDRNKVEGEAALFARRLYPDMSSKQKSVIKDSPLVDRGMAVSGKSVLEYFYAVPSSYFEMDVGGSKEERKSYIFLSDEKNAYIRFQKSSEGPFGDFTIFRTPGGPDLVAITNYVCGPICSPPTMYFLRLYKDGTWEDVTSKMLPKISYEEARTALYRKLDQDAIRDDSILPSSPSYDFSPFYNLPRYGARIQYIDVYSQHVLYEIVWQKDHFVLKKCDTEGYICAPRAYNVF